MDQRGDFDIPPGAVVENAAAPYEGVRNYFVHVRAAKFRVFLNVMDDVVLLPVQGEANLEYGGANSSLSREQVAVFVGVDGAVTLTTKGMQLLVVIAEGGNPDIRALTQALGLAQVPIMLTDPLWGDVAVLGAAVTRRSPQLPIEQSHAQARFLEELYRRTAALSIGQLTHEYRRSLHDRALDIIEVSAANPALNTHMIADMLGVSARSLQRRFADIGVTDHIRRRRVEIALALARTGPGKGMTLTQLAQAAGFADARALRRAIASTANSVLRQ
ncbi:helix-turn-helix domain-containing protein [Arthrobacter sp. RCC_34]|uniref:AraC family transcriptional regulator n=1 Tax=Arthrobacter sp. RCC_34 TaxID=3239230 RepID=UPI00352697F3